MSPFQEESAKLRGFCGFVGYVGYIGCTGGVGQKFVWDKWAAWDYKILARVNKFLA